MLKNPLSLIKNIIQVIIVGLACVALILMWQKFTPDTGIKIDRSHTAVIKEIQQLKKLETASFTIEKIIEANTQEGRFKELLFGDRILLIAHGKVVAGIDLGKIQEEDIKIAVTEGAKEKIHLKLPAPEIFHTIIDNKQTRVYDRKKGILTKGEKNLEAQARQAAEEEIKKAACEANILAEANASAEKQLTILLKALDFETVEIELSEGKCD